MRKVRSYGIGIVVRDQYTISFPSARLPRMAFNWRSSRLKFVKEFRLGNLGYGCRQSAAWQARREPPHFSNALFVNCMANSPSVAHPIMTFLTDFGTRDSFVGQMKGIAYGINPDVHLVDLTHDVAPQQILQGAYAWADAIDAFPDQSIHVGVVDPGVGSARSLIAAEIGRWRFVCPDNGLLSVILQKHALHRAVKLDRPEWWRKSVSNTFHGRDIITPVAAAWSLGRDLSEFGRPLDSPPMTLSVSRLNQGRSSIVGEVVDFDRYGNIITNIEGSSLPKDAKSIQIEIGSFRLSALSDCYSDVDVGDAVALVGSHGRLEIAVRDGSASEEFQVTHGRRVSIRWTESENAQ